MYKKNKPLSPITLHPGSSAALGLTIVGGVMCAIILLLSIFTQAVHPLYCGVVWVGFLPLILLFLLTDMLHPAKITLSTKGVHLYVRRSKAEFDLPWTNFHYMYRLEGNKRCMYLFTVEQMDKDAQVACYKACLKNKDVPFTSEGCLILDAWNDSDVIDPRLPEHIQKMSWKFCAKI